MYKIKEIVKITRQDLGETQHEFGKRFSVTDVAVSAWERGIRNVPNKVIEFCLNSKFKEIKKECPKCKGTGQIVITTLE